MKTQTTKNNFPSYLQITNFDPLITKKDLWHNTLDKNIIHKRLAYFLSLESGKFYAYTRNRTNAHATAWAVLICVCGFSRTLKADKQRFHALLF